MEINSAASRPREGEVSEGNGPSVGRERQEKAEVKKEEALATDKEERRKKKKEEKDVHKDKKSKASKKRQKSETREEASGVESAPVEEPLRRPKKVKEEEDNGSVEEGPEGPSSAFARSRSVTSVLQETVDTYAAIHPTHFELGTLPRRRSSHHGGEGHEEEPRRPERPREPDHPPPGFDPAEDRRSEIPRRWYPKPKKNKGGKHRERGRLFRQRQGRR